MATPEGKVKAKVKKAFKALGVWSFVPVSNGMGAHGIPDIVGCYRGRFVGVETKAPGRRGEANCGLSKLQMLQKKAIEDAGGLYFIIDGEQGDIDEMIQVLTK